MKVRFFIAMSALSIFLMGCGHAWVVSQDHSGGVIGFQGSASSSESVPGAVKNLIPCDNFKVVSNVPMTRQYELSTQNQMEAGKTRFYDSAGEGSHEQKAVEENKSWHQYTYSCTYSEGRTPSGEASEGYTQQHEFMYLKRGPIKF